MLNREIQHRIDEVSLTLGILSWKKVKQRQSWSFGLCCLRFEALREIVGEKGQTIGVAVGETEPKTMTSDLSWVSEFWKLFTSSIFFFLFFKSNIFAFELIR